MTQTTRPSRTQDTPGVYGWINMNQQQRRARARHDVARNNRVALIHLTQAYMQCRDMTRSTSVNHSTRIRAMLFELQDAQLTLHPPPANIGPKVLERLSQHGTTSPNTLRLHGASLRLIYDALAWAGMKPHDPFENLSILRVCHDIIQKTSTTDA